MNQKQNWYHKLWRPSMAWMYLVVCIFDFLVAPVASAWFQASFYKTAAYVPWNPITLGAGGLFHLSMMAIIGVTSWSRGQEKMKVLETLAAAAQGKAPPATEVPTPPVEPKT